MQHQMGSTTQAALMAVLWAAPTCGKPGLHLVDRVVQDLIDQVVQPPLPRAANVHARPLAHRLQALQHLHGGGQGTRT